MSVSIVNGYFCASSCDVSKAKQGQDPHPATSNAAADSKAQSAGRADQTAVVFGGALSGTSAIDPIQAVASAEPVNPATLRPGFTVDVLA